MTIAVVKLRTGSLRMFFIFKSFRGGFAPSNGTEESDGGIIISLLLINNVILSIYFLKKIKLKKSFFNL